VLTADGDVLLMCKGGAAVRAHRLLLSMTSNVLKDILDVAAAAAAASDADAGAAEPARKRQKTAAGAVAAAPAGAQPLVLKCEGDCPAMWRKVLALLYPVLPAERELSMAILAPVLRLADKCARLPLAAAASSPLNHCPTTPF
jgi:hypothetical protein